MSEKRNPLFLGRGSYRQRRLADAARLLPVLGAVLMMLPLLWPREGAENVPTTSTAMIYVFGCWLLLVAAAGLLAVWLDPTVSEAETEDDPARGS
ncbi:hypothetical protein [Pseudooceanicola sp.]|uniref:hypothetical protein n=1 Tax=Pseudooceanicola sp. TaxID=1914328 RepID=UPI0035C723C0